jgi:hypothetical protein
MSYILAGTTIRNPMTIAEGNSTQTAQVRPLSGGISRDLFGSNKRVWTFEYRNTKKAAYDAINAIYQQYLTTGAAQTFQSTETNYTISSTSVHVDLLLRKFSVSGSDYLSDFTLTLTEA